jgi:hypothetical protein
MKDKFIAWLKGYEQFVGKLGPDWSRKEIWFLSSAALAVFVVVVGGLVASGVQGTPVYFLFWLLAFAGAVAALVYAWHPGDD